MASKLGNAATLGDSTTLREASAGLFAMGCALMSHHLDEPALAGLIRREFEAITPENEFKPVEVQPERGRFDFTKADKIAGFAAGNGMKLIGHTLMWHQQSPGWMYEKEKGEALPRAEALGHLEAHIHAVAGHFKGRLQGWDVVNEVLADSEDRWLRDAAPWRAIGDDLTVRAFKFAQEADPSAELYYNDYNIDLPGKCTRALHLIEQLRAAGCRVDGIGIQGHWHLGTLNLPMIEAALVRFENAGLRMMITELDISVLEGETNPWPAGLPAEVEYKLAAAYAGVFALLARHQKHIDRVTFWGTHDGMSWLNGWPTPGRTNYPLVFDRQLRPKPAHAAVVAAMVEAGR